MKVAGVITEYNPFHNGHKYQLEQMQADFVANASHELRTPLSVLSGFTDEKEIEKRTEEVLKLVDMERFKNKQGDALSGVPFFIVIDHKVNPVCDRIDRIRFESMLPRRGWHRE